MLDEQIACLKDFDGDLTAFANVARYPVQDGDIVVTNELALQSRNAHVAHVPVIFGIAADDGDSIVEYSKACRTEVECIAANIEVSIEWAQMIVDSGLFPLHDTHW